MASIEGNDQPVARIANLADIIADSAPLVRALLVDERTAAHLYSLSTRALQEWRRRGTGPPFVRISSRCVRYRLGDLERWAADRLCTSTADTSPAQDG